MGAVLGALPVPFAPTERPWQVSSFIHGVGKAQSPGMERGGPERAAGG